MLTGLLAELDHYTVSDRVERQHMVLIQRALADRSLSAFDRSIPGHITASGIALSTDRREVALIWHEKIQRWLSPGGHCELDLDDCVESAARRELCEETGFPMGAVELAHPSIFDIDVHGIASPECQRHFDVRFLYRVLDVTASSPGAVKWVRPEWIADNYDESLARAARKVIALSAQKTRRQ